MEFPQEPQNVLDALLREGVHRMLAEAIEGEVTDPYPFVWLDALLVKSREEGRIGNVAVVQAIGVNADGYREILGDRIGNRFSKFPLRTTFSGAWRRPS